MAANRELKGKPGRSTHRDRLLSRNAETVTGKRRDTARWTAHDPAAALEDAGC